MPVYWSIISVTIVSMFFSRISTYKKFLSELEEDVIRKNILTTFSVLFILFFCGFRDRCIDTGAYIYSYETCPIGFSNFKSYVIDGGFNSFGFRLIELVLKTIFPESHYAWFFVVGAISIFCIYYGFINFSIDVPFSLYLFVASATFIWMFNGIRQFLAVSIIFASSKLFVEGKKIQFLFFLIISASIHMSAILLIPVFLLISNKRVLDIKFVLIGLIIAVFAIFSESFLPFVARILQKEYNEEMLNSGGSSIMRFFVASVPLILSMIAFKDTRNEANPVIVFGINMSYLGAIFNFAATFTNGVLVGRMPIYFTIYNFYLLPWLIQHKFNKARIVVKFACVILYFVYFYYQIQVAWDGLEYKSVFLGLNYL